jgi:dihydrofolate synthase/folylpolyglutamate synthase
MTLKELVLWQKQEYTGMKPGLERIKRFLKSAGNPQNTFRCVHVAGTNGKGSTAKIISAVLSESGYKTGLFISPHLIDITERIQINSRNIPKRELNLLSRRYLRQARQNKLTFFEFITALAFIYFKKNRIDAAVLETGLGGRFDATNVIKEPLACVITDIDFDHQAILGNTLSRIANEKAGIIKRGCPVISGVRGCEAARVVKRVSRLVNAELYEYGKDFNCASRKVDWLRGRQKFRYNGIKSSFDAELSLLGFHQLRNCGLALAVVELMGMRGFHIGRSRIRKALKSILWPGRFEVRKTIVLDGAHNPGAARNFTETWNKSPFRSKKAVLIFGMLQDKSIKEVIKLLPKNIDKVVLTKVDSPRAETTENLAGMWKKYIPAENIIMADSLKAALDMTSKEELTLITGSLYLVGNALKLIKK